MPSEFDDLMLEAVAEAFDVIGRVTVKRGDVSKGGVISDISQTKGLRNSGTWLEATCVAEFERADFVALQLVQRTQVIIGETRYSVTNIDNDPHDPCVRVGLKEDR